MNQIVDAFQKARACRQARRHPRRHRQGQGRQLHGESARLVRGRAIRMLQRDVPFGNLEIDFEALEKRKVAEYDKLNRIVRIRAERGLPSSRKSCTISARARPAPAITATIAARASNTILPAAPSRRTEGKAALARGAHGGQAVAEEAVEEGAIEAVRMVLSGVARSESRIACGKNLIAQMLCGSNSAKIKKLRLNQLSTFGLLWQLKQAEVVTLIDILIAIGCLEQENIDRFRPVLKLTPLGGEVMWGKADLPAGLKLPGELRLKLRRPVAKDAAGPTVAGSRGGNRQGEGPAGCGGAVRSRRNCPPPAAQPGADCPSLRSERPHLADLSYRGRCSDDCGRGPGIHSRRRCAPGRAVRAIPCRDAQSAPDRVSAPAMVNRPSYYWTWRLFPKVSRGKIHGDPRNHARSAAGSVCQAAENGLEVRAAWCLSAETIAALETMIGDSPPNQIRPLLAELPPGTRYEEVQVYLKMPIFLMTGVTGHGKILQGWARLKGNVLCDPRQITACPARALQRD